MVRVALSEGLGLAPLSLAPLFAAHLRWTGTLYGSIKRMLAEGLIEETAERPDPELDDQRRRYYRLTGLGERVCASELQRLEALIRRAGSPDWARKRMPRVGEA
jgi:DNA-binding PadR family transcriptional regulator